MGLSLIRSSMLDIYNTYMANWKNAKETIGKIKKTTILSPKIEFGDSVR